ncbi:hypothetical protein SAMN03159463_05872 [Mesorhizobium sp. NFR06]|jgi:hypothetical protein|uniref:hypothetical protein n=1 Tax=Mesorhizobium sp. NFR06 TaxID=1566290 RepID=UPI0008E26B64|nr:hypothetical protein [Mesorhizobium sp. NFR06]SFQ17675.1 hypothetical protein SAMN03159463_05872 [Mesorhizobium sp. NFR06]
MIKSSSKPRKTAIPAAPAWMNPSQKRDFSALLALENGWKGFTTDIELQRFGDRVDLRGRILGMRRLMRSAMRSKDVATVLSLNSALNSTTAQAQRLEDALSLQDRQKTTASARRAA